MREVMVDLETWGTSAGCAIRSIGACEWVGYNIERTFYENIDDNSSRAAELLFDLGTIDWWSQQSEEAKFALTANQKTLSQVLRMFSSWLGNDAKDPVMEAKNVLMWGNGFDLPVLQYVYEKIGSPVPWHYRKERCYRTVKSMFQTSSVRPTIPHHALEDAIAQARTLTKIREEHALETPDGHIRR